MFSGTVKLLDLNDFINPSEECVVVTQDKDLKKNIKDDIELPDLIKKSKNQKAQIKLEDCLACSGCITSSENLLIEEQSIKNMLNSFEKFDQKILMISPQSRLSLANKLNISTKQCQLVLEQVAKKIGFDFCVDFQFFIEFCNFLEYQLYKQYKQNKQVLLSSECPGWICYLEKVVDEKIIPYASGVKPPQLLCASFLKKFLMKKQNINFDNICVVLLAPCFDKKLESIREEQKNGTKVIDTVISTKEIYDYCTEQNFFSIDVKNLQIDQQKILDLSASIKNVINDKNELVFIDYTEYQIYRSFEEYGSSNGYLDYILNQQIQNHQAILKDVKIDKKKLIEITLEYPNGQIEKLALVYGFRNIQNMIRKIKMKKIRYSYCEVMACPSGCLGGGAQISYESTQENKQQIKNLIELNKKELYKSQNDLVYKLNEKMKEENFNLLTNKDLIYKIDPIKKNTTSWQLIIFSASFLQITKPLKQII